jgi:hypothetical protein
MAIVLGKAYIVKERFEKLLSKGKEMFVRLLNEGEYDDELEDLSRDWRGKMRLLECFSLVVAELIYEEMRSAGVNIKDVEYLVISVGGDWYVWHIEPGWDLDVIIYLYLKGYEGWSKIAKELEAHVEARVR